MRAPLLPRGPIDSTVQLPTDVADVVRAALRRRAHGSCVIVFDGDANEVRVEDRELLIASYRRTGIRELVTALRTASVPPTHEIALVDLERAARVISVDREALLGPELMVCEPSAGFLSKEVG